MVDPAETHLVPLRLTEPWVWVALMVGAPIAVLLYAEPLGWGAALCALLAATRLRFGRLRLDPEGLYVPRHLEQPDRRSAHVLPDGNYRVIRWREVERIATEDRWQRPHLVVTLRSGAELALPVQTLRDPAEVIEAMQVFRAEHAHRRHP